MVLAVSALFVVVGCSSDDGDGGSGMFSAPSGEPGSPVAGAEGDGAAFTDASRATFTSNCLTFDGATDGLCECAWSTITQTVSATEYQQFEAEFLQNPSTDLPDWLTSAVSGCSGDN